MPQPVQKVFILGQILGFNFCLQHLLHQFKRLDLAKIVFSGYNLTRLFDYGLTSRFFVIFRKISAHCVNVNEAGLTFRLDLVLFRSNMLVKVVV